MSCAKLVGSLIESSQIVKSTDNNLLDVGKHAIDQSMSGSLALSATITWQGWCVDARKLTSNVQNAYQNGYDQRKASPTLRSLFFQHGKDPATKKGYSTIGM